MAIDPITVPSAFEQLDFAAERIVRGDTVAMVEKMARYHDELELWSGGANEFIAALNGLVAQLNNWAPAGVLDAGSLGVVSAEDGDSTAALSAAIAQAQAEHRSLHIPFDVSVTAITIDQAAGPLNIMMGGRLLGVGPGPVVKIVGSSSRDFERPVRLIGGSIAVHSSVDPTSPLEAVVHLQGARHCGLFQCHVDANNRAVRGVYSTDGTAGGGFNRHFDVTVEKSTGFAWEWDGVVDRGADQLGWANRDTVLACRAQTCEKGTRLHEANTHTIQIDHQNIASQETYSLSNATGNLILGHNEGGAPHHAWHHTASTGNVYIGSGLSRPGLTTTEWRQSNQFVFLDGTAELGVVAKENSSLLFSANGGSTRAINLDNGAIQKYRLNQSTQFVLPAYDPRDAPSARAVDIYLESLGQGHTPGWPANATVVGTEPDWALSDSGYLAHYRAVSFNDGADWLIEVMAA